MTPIGYQPRLLDQALESLFGQLPGILLVGPRAAGKTTTAARFARSIVRLDREAEAAAFRADPDAALRRLEEPVLLDEWQVVPGVLGAVKRAIDARPEPGRFLVTGSVRADLEEPGWPATGRLVRLTLHGMTVRELVGDVGRAAFVDRLASGEPLSLPGTLPDLGGYVEMALRSGFPEPALRYSGPARERWLESYVEQLLTRDAAMLESGRDPERMRRYFEALALNTAGVVDHKSLYDAAGIDRRTGLAYDRLLENLLVVESLPAWTSNRLKRLSLLPKRHVVDPGLVAGALRLTVADVMRDGDLLGRLLDSFVTAQLRAELPISTLRPRLFHLRQKQGRHELDLIAEIGGRGVMAFEVKADAAPRVGTATHLTWLREQLAERFLAGVVFHTGPGLYELGERIHAVPIAALWG